MKINSISRKNFFSVQFMNVEYSIKKKIFELEALEKLLLAENEILWDEVNAINRDLASLKRILAKNIEIS
jgi:hypothetical protein